MVRAEDDAFKHFKREVERVAAPFMTLKREVMTEYLFKTSVMTPEKEKEKELTLSKSSLHSE
jgi:hypothetical protein